MWNIVTDSACDDINFEHSLPEISYTSVPFVINTDHGERLDDGSIDIPELMEEVRHSHILQTACPSPAAFKEAFEQPGDTFAFTISANLSGSYESACAAKHMVDDEQPGKNIAVVNSMGTGPTQILLIRRITRLIEEGLDFHAIYSRLDELVGSIKIIYALNSFDNLVRNGRMSRLAGFVAHKLNFWGVGIASPEGRIQIKGKVRGTKRALQTILDDIRERGQAVSEVVICHCLNPEAANELKESILAAFRNIRVDVFPTGGLDSFYAEKSGLIVSYF